nr:hypothetical protein [Tanacetum cinerariifolium]
MDQLEKQLDKEEFQKIRSIAAFKVLETQFQKFIKSRSYLDDEYVVMTRKALHKREYEIRVNEKQMQTTEEKVDTSKALDASLVETQCCGTKSKKEDTSSSSRNNAHIDDVDIKPVYDEEPTAELQLTAECYVFATRQQHTEQPEFNNEGEVDQNVKQYHDTHVIETINVKLEHKMAKLLEKNETLKRHYKELSDSIEKTRAKTIEHTTSLIAQNAEFTAQLQEKGFAIAALKNELRKLTGNSVNTKERESAFAKPHHMIVPSSSMYSSNDMVHNHYLEEAKKKTQESGRNSRPNVMPSATSESTANDCKPKPKINNQNSRNWPASNSSTPSVKKSSFPTNSSKQQDTLPSATAQSTTELVTQATTITAEDNM